MPLTLDQAALAGQLAAGIAAANAAITDLDVRIAEAVPFVRMAAERTDGQTIRAEIVLDAEASVELLEFLKAKVEAKRDAAQAALDAITIA